MPDETKLPTVREHADKLISDMVANGAIAPDAEAATRATGMPTFSKGTATLDPNTGKPVAPAAHAAAPTFTEGGVAIPDGSPSALPVGTPAPVAEAPAPSAAAVAGAGAAEAAAQAVADAFAEYDEFEVEDADLDLKYPVRVPKQFADSAKRAYPRRAVYDRTVSRYKAVDPVLSALIEDGRMQQILPALQRALNDPAYGEYVWTGYERAQRGLPLMEQARQEAAAAAVAAPDPGVGEFALDDPDPFFAERVRPLVQRYESLEQKVNSFEQQRVAEQQRASETQRQNEWRGQQLALAHQDLTARYPGSYTGDLRRDQAVWQRTVEYARDAGYVDAYGPRAALVLAGDVIQRMEQERLAATASPAATALAAAENVHMDLARQQAAAASRTVGAGAATPAPPPARPTPPTSFNADGSIKPPAQYLREQQNYHATARVPA